MARYCTLPGTEVLGQSLTIQAARAFWRYLSSGVHPYAHLVSAKRYTDGSETVIFDVEPELNQIRVFPIESTERLAVVFAATRPGLPDTLALRDDFPLVPHINPTEQEFPRNLCLYEERWEELRLRWTVAGHIERCREWLSENAAGRLHKADQPMEQIFVGALPPLILPADFSFTNEGRPLYVDVLRRGNGQYIFFATHEPQGHRPAVPLVLSVPASVNQQVRCLPGNLKSLTDLLGSLGLDLIAELSARLRSVPADQRDGVCVPIVGFPQLREPGGSPERYEVWAFATSATIEEIGQALGLWLRAEGYGVGALIGQRVDEAALASIGVMVLDPVKLLTRSSAAELNGFAPSEQRVVAIGAGTLGSRVIMIAVREGFGAWTILDFDFLAPHNVARHELTSIDVPLDKALSLAARANQVYAGAVRAAYCADILETGVAEVAIALADAEVICDMSASLAVARFLANDHPGTARRVSVFLNPIGNSIVLLCEDAARTVKLDDLEMQYYRLVANTETLRDHLAVPVERIRVARSCREVTSRVADENVTIFAGAAVRLLRRVTSQPNASAIILKLEDNSAMTRFDVPVSDVRSLSVGKWRLRIDNQTLERMHQHRRSRLQNETGGVLLGSVDMSRNFVYVADMIPAPSDSEEYPTSYTRGVAGLSKRVNEVVRLTDGQLRYIGEWHSHPDGHTTDRSKDDSTLWDWLVENMNRDGIPATMCIVGERDENWFVAEMEN